MPVWGKAFSLAGLCLLLLPWACLPKRSSQDDNADMFSISAEENQKARTRESLCRESGGVFKKDSCYTGTTGQTLDQETCDQLPGWRWHAASGKCLPLSTVKNLERCEAKGQVFDQQLGDCTLAESARKDCDKESGLVWDGEDCVPESEPRNFYRLCTQKSNPPSVQHTIDQLKKMFSLNTCEDTFLVLSRKRILYLQNKNLENLEPLRGLKNLESLVLGKNKISDLSPLSTLKNLVYLDLYENQVKDLTPIQNNVKLQTIYLNNNPVNSITALRNLAHIKEILLEGTPVHESSRDQGVCPHDARSSLVSSYCRNK